MYCSLADLQKRISVQEIIRLVSDSGSEPDFEDTSDAGRLLVEAAIISAGTEIDFACAGRYTVPLSPIPARIVDICVDISVYNLFKRRFRDIPELIVKQYDDAKKELNEIAKGNRILNVNTSEENSPGGGMAVNKTNADKTYNLEGYL
ncbi:MAG: DUF1320 domain-containing protein [Ignavibacteriales bacterium]|jgi:Mu-like prophage protein gp36|nr:MAG: DUF1320 domain-containing protein [Ignavibacteriaceae bacterium]MBW7872847.1 DUF1320 domain-containing protein [Ignavibacteria bacterium]MCZ2143567.1 DUF1320 domain-containing protein [Ignavibacteriales bacterium]OQY73323.1 MAG: hypothetical protein B6D45_08255 [Ignavibacteriales bacterium UTCHB3]MBV6444442.1 hypothetical protein [Ignavibacteriaceae bacterium]